MTSHPEVAPTPAACLRIYICTTERRQNREPSAAPAIPTRTKSASTIATWILFGSTPPSALCPMGCQATEADVPLVDNQLNLRAERLSAAFVLTQTLSAMVFVFQVACRESQSGASTKFLARDDSLMTFYLLLFPWAKWKPSPPLVPSTLLVSTSKDLWSLTRLKFLYIRSLGEGSIKLSGFKNT